MRMTDEAAARIEDRFDNLSQDFWQLMEKVPGMRTDIETAAGDFSSEISGYTGIFESGWKTTFEIGSRSAGLIAGNTNAMHLDLNKLDRDLSHNIDLTP
jgi:hypothetical protein